MNQSTSSIWLPYQYHPNINPSCFSELVNETRTTMNNKLHDAHLERKKSLSRRRSFRANIVCIAKENCLEEQIIDENYHEYLEQEDADWLHEVQSMLEGIEHIDTHWSFPSPIKRRKGVRRRKVRPSLSTLQKQLSQSFNENRNSSVWSKVKNAFIKSDDAFDEYTIEDLILVSQGKLQSRRSMLQQILVTNTLRIIEPTKFKQIQVKDKRKRRDPIQPRFGSRAITRRKSFESVMYQNNENFASPAGFTFCIRQLSTKQQLSDDSFPEKLGFIRDMTVRDTASAQLHTIGLRLQNSYQVFFNYFENEIGYTTIEEDDIQDYEYVHHPPVKRRSNMETDSGVDLAIFDEDDDIPLHNLKLKRRLSISSAP